MKASLLILICAVVATAQASWFEDVVSGIQEGIKESFEETQKKLIQTHMENAEKKEGVKGFLKSLSKHMDEWQKHYAKKYAVNGSQALNRKAKKLWNKIQVHVIKKLQKNNGTALEKHELSKLYLNGEKLKKKIMKKIKKKQEKKANKIKHAKKHELHRVPLMKDEVIGAKRLLKAQKLFKKLSAMWSKTVDEKRKEYHMTEEKPQTEEEEAEPSPETITTEEQKEAKGIMSVLSNPQEIAKRVMQYADMSAMPTAETPKKEEVPKRTSLFFQMRKPKNKETGPHFSKEEEEAIRKVFKSTIMKEKEADPITSSEAEAEKVIKEEEKKFEEREKELEAAMRHKQEEMRKEEKVFPSIKDIPSKTILPAFIKMESLPGHRDDKTANGDSKDMMKKEIEESKHEAEDVESIPVGDNEHMLLLPHMQKEDEKEKIPKAAIQEPQRAIPELEEKKLPEEPKPDNEELWIKFPDTGKKMPKAEKVSAAQFEKMDGDLPSSLEDDYEEKGEGKRPDEPVMVEPKRDFHPPEERETTMNPRDVQGLDDKEFLKKLAQEEDQWAKFKKNLMAKFDKLTEKAKRRPWQAIRDFGARLPGKFEGVIHNFNKEPERKANYEEP